MITHLGNGKKEEVDYKVVTDKANTALTPAGLAVASLLGQRSHKLQKKQACDLFKLN